MEEESKDNERLELRDRGSIYFLGPNLTLRNCEIILNVPARNLVIRQACFDSCTFEVKQELKNHQSWVYASIKGCRFKGRMSGCDFGHWPGYSEGAENGSIEDCDFSEARLDGCRFMGCEPATLRFPSWPCFTILDPIANSERLNRVKWPGVFGDVVVKNLGTQPEPTRALTKYAPAIAKRMDTTPEALKAVIDQFDCIVY
jgi:hypothetical protein